MDRLKLFKEELGKRLAKELGKEVPILFESRTRNNGCRESAVTISRAGCNYAVRFSLNNVYDFYCENLLSVESIATEMIRELEIGGRITRTTEKIGEYESVKDKIHMNLVNAGANRELLALTPHIPYLDLAVTFYLQIDTSQQGSTNLKISEGVLAMWGKKVEDIYADALRNMEKEPVLPQPITDVMKQIFADMQGDIKNGESDLLDAFMFESLVMEKDEDMLYVLTNQDNLHGACRMLDTGALQNLAKSLGKNLYLIPSSVHEILIFPDQGKWQPEEIENMIREVNQNEVAPEDRLSNAVYLFDRNTLSTRIVREGEPL